MDGHQTTPRSDWRKGMKVKTRCISSGILWICSTCKIKSAHFEFLSSVYLSQSLLVSICTWRILQRIYTHWSCFCTDGHVGRFVIWLLHKCNQQNNLTFRALSAWRKQALQFSCLLLWWYHWDAYCNSLLGLLPLIASRFRALNTCGDFGK